jgi:hypothetical protein
LLYIIHCVGENISNTLKAGFVLVLRKISAQLRYLLQLRFVRSFTLSYIQRSRKNGPPQHCVPSYQGKSQCLKNVVADQFTTWPQCECRLPWRCVNYTNTTYLWCFSGYIENSVSLFSFGSSCCTKFRKQMTENFSCLSKDKGAKHFSFLSNPSWDKL